MQIGKNKIQNESKTARRDFFKFFKPISNFLKEWCKISSLLKELCNQTKLWHHYVQTVLLMFKIWCNQNKLLHHYFQQFWTCLKYDTIKTNYCITFINAFKTSFSFSKDDVIKTNYCITISLFSNSFEHVSNMMGPEPVCWPGLAWATKFHFFFKKFFLWQRSFKNRNPRG